MGVPTVAETVNRQQSQKFKWSFANVIAGGIDTARGTLLMTGSGMTVDQIGGNLVVGAGTTAFSETIIRGIDAFAGQFFFRYGMTLSQRIANNNFAIELVDIVGDGLAFTVNNATSVTVTKTAHGFAAIDIGKGLWIGALSLASCPTQRAVIASVPTADTLTLTVSGFPGSGTGTCSLFGYTHHQVLYNGTTATSLGGGYTSQRLGWANTAVNASTNSTASPGHIGIIDVSRNNDASYLDQAQGTSTSLQATARAAMSQNVPDYDAALYLQIRVFNGSSAPATGTTMTLSFIDFEYYSPQLVNISGIEPLGWKNALPVTVRDSSLSIAGTAAHSAATSGNPVRIGGKVVTAADTTLVASDVSDLFMTSGGAAIVKDYAAPELDWSYAAATLGIANSSTAVTVKAAAGAGLRNYITSMDLFHEALTTATEFAIRDGAAGTVIWRTKIPSGASNRINVVFPSPLRGTASTLLEIVTLTASGAGAVYANLQGYVAL